MDSIRQKEFSRLFAFSKVLLLAFGCLMASSLLVMDEDVTFVAEYEPQCSLFNWSKARALVDVYFYQRYRGGRGCLLESFEYVIEAQTAANIRLPSVEDSKSIVVSMSVVFNLDSANKILYDDITMVPGGSYMIRAVTDTIPSVEQAQQ